MEKVADKEEMLLVVDENDIPTNRYEKRSFVHENQLFHNEVALWIIDKESKKVLMQRRSKNKKLFPNRLGLIAGHVVGDDTILDTLKKETKEEVGLDLGAYEVFPLTVLKRNNNPANYCFSHHFYIVANIPVENFVLQEEEVSEVMYMDYEKLKEMIKNDDEEVCLNDYNLYKKVFEKLDKVMYE